MKKFTQAILGAVMATMFLTTTAVADDFDSATIMESTFFGCLNGVITEVTPFVDSDNKEKEGYYLVHMETEDKGEVVFSITDETYFASGSTADLQVGLNVAGYYDANAPMIMIYPPRHNAIVFDLGMETESSAIKVDRFDDGLLSSDGLLKLNIAENGKNIFTQDGTAYEGSLANKNLVIYYTIATMSIPAQTSPIKIVILDYEGLNIPELPNEEVEYTIDVSQMPIVVERQIVDAPDAYNTKDGAVMVPVRAISEALGYKVGWDSSRNEVSVGMLSTFTEGKDYYTYARTAPINLGIAPEISADGVMYVPLSYFKQVLRVNNAYVFEGQIVIDNGEVME